MFCHGLSFQVYTRLSKLAISTTHKTALQAVKKLGSNHDAQVISEPDYIVVGDNIDKNVTPRDMTVGNQVKSLHYFHSYAVKDQAVFLVMVLSGMSNIAYFAYY